MVEGWAKLPAGRKWGSTGAVDIDRDGKSVWVAERCGANTCLDRETGRIKNVDPILKFDEHGNLVKSFGAGLLVGPHGIYVDREDNVWVTDYQDDGPVVTPAPGGPKPIGPPPGTTKGHQVWKFSPEGKVLMKLGKPGGAAAPDYFFAPNDVIVAPDGSIFVSEGHGGGNSRILKFSKDGRLIKTWGKLGTGPGDFDMPHGLAFDSKGLLYVADRGNNRIQVFDQEGNYLSEMKQFGRPAGLFIDARDNIYVADSDSLPANHSHDGWRRGIRIGSLKDGKVVAYIPDPVENPTGTHAAEGVAVDARGNIYGAEVGNMALKRYER
jgi:DNA-binding beta-propeller fold protein YncE